MAAEYVAKVRNLASEERVQHLKKIENAYHKCKEYSDDKVQLAMQIYEMVSCRILSLTFFMYTFIKTWCLCYQVDKHIRQLDADLARFENDLQEKLDSGIQDSSDEKQSQSKCFCTHTHIYTINQ